MAQSFFKDDAFNFKVQCMLGELRSGCGDAGESFSAVEKIADGDDASWVAEWQALWSSGCSTGSTKPLA